MPLDLDEEDGARGDDDGVDLVATAAGLDEILEGEEVEGSPVGEHLSEVLHGDLLVVVRRGADFLA
ncbi:MAG: hypothetical protein IPF99_32845 [Deltaproteobacteria bacterium]|nr:hypothetical protein [Deltaproteobacteria bacterium]